MRGKESLKYKKTETSLYLFPSYCVVETLSPYRLEQQQQADSLVVVGAQQDQGGGVLSPCLLQQHKARNHEAARLCTRRSGRSLKLGKEEPKDEGGEGFAKVKV